MPSSTSSSDVFERELPTHRWAVILLLALVLFGAGIAAWEYYWRTQGAESGDYINSNSLWVQERRKVESNSVVFTGSSRVLFGLQTDVWEQETGTKPIQLALEGTSPMSIFEGLADDQNFKGTVFVGVSPGLFYSGFEYRGDVLDLYQREPPSQWVGQKLSMLIEPYFGFMDGDFALFTILARQSWPAREGVRTSIDVRKLSVSQADRNTQMWSRVVEDKDYADLAIKIWSQRFVPIEERDEAWIERMKNGRQKQIDRAAEATKKIQTRGGEVIFVRMPAQGYYTKYEGMYHPREQTWDALLEASGARGIHFEDYPELNQYTLPEDSHLKAEDARQYTRDFLKLL